MGSPLRYARREHMTVYNFACWINSVKLWTFKYMHIEMNRKRGRNVKKMKMK